MTTGWDASQTCSNMSEHISGKPLNVQQYEQLRLHISGKPSNVQQDKWFKTKQLGQAIKLTVHTYVHVSIDRHAPGPRALQVFQNGNSILVTSQ